MKKIIFACLLGISSGALATEKVDEILQTARDIGIENYKAPEAVTEAISQSYESRLTLDAESKRRVDTMAEIIQSEEFANQQKVWRESLASQLGVDDWAPANASPASPSSSAQTLPYSDRAILFISATLPAKTLKNYAADLEKVGGVMVMRGFVSGMNNIKPTMQFIDSVTKRNSSCKAEPCERFNVPVLIDPILFKEYQIDRVPTLAVHGLTNLAAYCNGKDGLNASDTVVYGDSSLKHLLTTLSQQEPTNLNILSMIDRL